MQLQMQNQQRINALLEAQAKADLARSKEDISDIQVNRASIALKNAQTMTEIKKLRGETDRAPTKEAFDMAMQLVDKILDSIGEAWNEQLDFCEICPTRCISEKDVFCTMFDDETFK